MELTNKRIIKELLKKYNAKPEKYLGQHFILSKKALALMIATAKMKKNDTVIEIGPGLGTLTQELVKTGANVIAIEKDPLMVGILKEIVAYYKNIKITQADARQLLMSDINRVNRAIDVGHQYKVVANLPYNVATFLIRRWLELKNPPKLMVLMIQKEVAQRIIAEPPYANLLGTSIQFYANAEIIDYVKKESFWPRPKVDAAIIKITPRRNERYQSIGRARSFSFFKVVKAGFSQPRKQLIGNLVKKLKMPRERFIEIFQNLNISNTARAENLSLDQWLLLANSIYSFLKREENKF